MEAVVNDMRPRVLLAGTAEAIDKFQALLGAEVEIIPARSVREALARADGDIDLILCNVRFDDSRMFDFLGALQEGAYRHVPVVCFRNEPGSLQPARAPTSSFWPRPISLTLSCPAPYIQPPLRSRPPVARPPRSSGMCVTRTMYEA